VGTSSGNADARGTVASSRGSNFTTGNRDGKAGDTECSVAASTSAAHDSAADWPASCVQGPDKAGLANRLGWRPGSAGAFRSWSSDSRPADFPASASRGSNFASCAASGRTQAYAPDAAVADRHASAGRGSRSFADRAGNPPRHSARWASTQAGAALHSAWSEGRPDEGLHSAATIVSLQ